MAHICAKSAVCGRIKAERLQVYVQLIDVICGGAEAVKTLLSFSAEKGA